LTALTDPSNRDDRFDRARMRKALASADWIDTAALSKSAAVLADAEVALNWAVEQAAATHLRTSAGVSTILNPLALPIEIRRRLVVRALAAIDPAASPSGPETMRLIETLSAGGKASIGALIGESRATDWHFSQAPPRSARNAVSSA
jgi:tRNA(Ile)-lysidine synthase